MYGRRLATVERIIALVSPNSDDAQSVVQAWASENDLPVEMVPVGDTIDSVYEPDGETLGVTLGGDGTYLEGVRQFSPYGIPILGVNAGSLAFLAGVSPDDLPAALTETVTGAATIDRRQQLHVRAPGVDCTGINDVMIEHEPPENPVDRKISRLQVFIDEEYIGEYEGSGVAVSTPTGSTGVSLSAGGPVHLPMNNDTLQLLGLHTHSMGVRPVVFDSDSTVEIVATGGGSLLVDGGRAHTTLDDNAVIRISGADTQAFVVSTSYDDDFFTSIAEKLGWAPRTDRHDSGPEALLTDRPTQSSDLRSRARRVASEAARAAGETLRETHGTIEDVTIKSDTSDIVTAADYRSNDIITTVLKEEFPEFGIRSEESDPVAGSSKFTWLIDPLDGTGNYAHHNPNYSISIALLEDETPVMGVVYAPETDELFSAIEGAGATVNGTPLSTTDRSSLAECMLLSGYDPNGEFIAHCYESTRGVRSLGSSALNLCYLARGSADAVWEYDTYPWDVAAGVVIAREAGATVTTADGARYSLGQEPAERNELLGSNGPIHQALVAHLEAKQSLQLAD